jgi:hypothetical protein
MHKKSFLGTLLVCFLVLGLVFVACDSGSGGDDDEKEGGNGSSTGLEGTIWLADQFTDSEGFIISGTLKFVSNSAYSLSVKVRAQHLPEQTYSQTGTYTRASGSITLKAANEPKIKTQTGKLSGTTIEMSVQAGDRRATTLNFKKQK